MQIFISYFQHKTDDSYFEQKEFSSCGEGAWFSYFFLLPALLLRSCGRGIVDITEGSLQSLLLLTSFSQVKQ